MKKYFLIFLALWSNYNLFAQKNVVDSSCYGTWPALGDGVQISNDGKFLAYAIEVGKPGHRKMLHVIQSCFTNWKIEMKDVKRKPGFTENSRFCVLLTNSDTLKIVDLLHKSIFLVTDISEFEVRKQLSGDWITYRRKDEEHNLILKNLETREEIVYKSVKSDFFSDDGKFFVLQRYTKYGDSQSLEWFTSRKRVITIWNGAAIENLTLDFKHRQLAFKVNKDIFYWKEGMLSPICIYTDRFRVEDELKSVIPSSFNDNGDYLSLRKLMKDTSVIFLPKGVPEVWSFNDAKLQTVQEKEITERKYRTTENMLVFRLVDHKIFDIPKKKNEHILQGRQFGDMLLSKYVDGDGSDDESGWNIQSKVNWNLINLKTGERRALPVLQDGKILNFGLSPVSKYVIYFNFQKNGYFSYNVSSGKTVNLTANIHASWRIAGLDPADSTKTYALRGIAGWIKDDENVLIYDNYDIWKLDPSGKEHPVNLTNAYGSRHGLIFSLAFDDFISTMSISKTETLLFTVFNKRNKENGFFRKAVNKPGDPEKLTMGAYLYKISSINSRNALDFSPIRSKNGKVYLLKRQSSIEAPNFFCTRDFKTFHQLTNIQPQSKYNWYKSELHTWKSLNGEDLQGILYKPENFDGKRKYPIIFSYYQKLSDGLNSFFSPDYSHGGIDIATYVSNEYLIFCPDINYPKSNPMQGTYEAIVSCANYVATLPYVNVKKMGLQGFSFGAVQTNFLITHTDLFSAACSGSGMSDWISGYGTLRGNNRDGYDKSNSGNFDAEGQLRMNHTLWGNLRGYVESSPILQAHRVTTPILLMHTKNDRVCPFSNILEFYLGLRRLGKKSWLLVYPTGTHTLYGNESMDFTIRMQQFFDHYLKDMPAPVWMLDGVPAEDRSFGAGTEMDNKGRTPGRGLLTEAQQKEVDSLMTRKPITITLR